MEATIQSNQIGLDKEEARPNPDLASLPQERHVWRMPEFPPIPQVQIQNLVQSSQGRGVGNMPKPLAGGQEFLLTHQELSGSGEDHRYFKRVAPIVLQIHQKYKELVNEPSLLSIDQKKELEMTPSLEKEGPVASTSSTQLHKCPKPRPRDLKRSRKVPRAIM
ncbi:hypothetical protein O181_040806 [Austropuccinia psidii MF-1]|uniref:Uncharacterized protein n=1 Tax=Austropuccinia psidii MF-1 TaxID=1389203 RepID=A0A9Q3DC20_9BASI|nr:hypothetical protein [Austropuccinia psidii MF-1]